MNSSENDIISNLDIADSPNTTDTVYYALYRKSRVEEVVWDRKYLFKLGEQWNHDYEPNAISSITAQEIRATGTLYNQAVVL